MSLDFQATLSGNKFASSPLVPRDLAIGSYVMLRNMQASPRCWLHSHPHRYPIYPSGDEKGLASSHQQQVGNW